MPESGTLVQFGILGAFIFVAKTVFDFVLKILEVTAKMRNRRNRANGVVDEDYESKILINGTDFRRLVDSIEKSTSATETNTKAIRTLVDGDQELQIELKDVKRVLHRNEKVLDRFDN